MAVAIDDGSVTMEIQGTEENIDRVILAVEAGRYVRIENIKPRLTPHFSGTTMSPCSTKAVSIL